jgi:hypothetical protein
MLPMRLFTNPLPVCPGRRAQRSAGGGAEPRRVVPVLRHTAEL